MFQIENGVCMSAENISANEVEVLLKGSYDYRNNDNIYCQEKFQVQRNLSELTTEFVSESLSRVSTGEMLKIKVNYTIGKDWIPKSVMIDRSLGINHVIETFECNQRTNKLQYTFMDIAEKKVDEYETSTPPRFHISTPTVASGFLFIMSKKFDNTGDNNYTLIGSSNRWEFVDKLIQKNIAMRKLDHLDENIKVEGANFQGTWYRIRSVENTDEFSVANIESSEHDYVEIMLSKYITIPLSIKQPDGTTIVIQSFTNLSDTL